MPDQRTSTYKPNATRMLAIGLMSGTSADGVDAALLRTDGQDHIEFIAAATLMYETTLRDALLEVAKHDIPLSSLLRLEGAITAAHVDACETLLRKTSDRVSRKDVAIIGE